MGGSRYGRGHFPRQRWRGEQVHPAAEDSGAGRDRAQVRGLVEIAKAGQEPQCRAQRRALQGMGEDFGECGTASPAQGTDPVKCQPDRGGQRTGGPRGHSGQGAEQSVQRGEPQQSPDALNGEVAGGGGAKHDPGNLGGAAALRKVRQSGHRPHRVADQNQRPACPQRCDHIIEVGGQLSQPVGVRRRRARGAVTPMVIGDDAGAVVEAVQHMSCLDAPRSLAQA